MSRRLLVKLSDRIDNGDYYEAHQIYRTIYYRLIKENKHSEVYDLLYGGAIKLLERGQFNSGADLANTIVEMMTKLNSVDNLNHTEEELVNNIKNLFELIQQNSPERIQFVTKALQIPFLPSTTIRKQFAEVLWKEKSFAESRLHFIYSSDSGDNCALMLVEYQTTLGFQSEVDLMIAQFVFQVLCCEKKQLANKTFYCYTLNHPQIRCTKAPFMMPLLNFIFFLLIAIDRYSGKSAVFNVLCNLYEKTLNRDPCYKDYLSQIGQIYFGLEKKTKSGGLFSNLIQSLFDNMSDNDNFHQESDPVGQLISNNLVQNEDVDLD